jgi:DNA-binding transcriptional regulator LsrR (DeoR family)
MGRKTMFVKMSVLRRLLREGKSQKEVAKALGISRRTVARRLDANWRSNQIKVSDNSGEEDE